ncbi:MAG TPA: lipoyl(octanoyl) transferase LipB [Candidatus Binatia bacterium]|nr:lipoyl(octanoyl) transferase LipB [Candidatus Binatia bacterium]
MNELAPVEVRWLGLVAYEEAWDLQKRLVADSRRAAHQDQLLLLEHPPVYTLGRSGHAEHLLLDEDTARREGIAVYWVDRGGDVTYHGPGQLVGYPILDLRRLYASRGLPRPDLHGYLREIEETIIRALDELGIRGWRYKGFTGVWVDGDDGPSKIAAIGVKVSSNGVSSHGFALNVDPNLHHFRGIVPCGIQEYGVTSMAQLLGQPIAVGDVLAPLVAAFSRAFGLEVQFVTLPHSA